MTTTTQRPKFSPQHYNAIAKEIREIFPQQTQTPQGYVRAALTAFALNLAKRFKEDNPQFDPLKFLDACSPNTDLYPLSELWEA